MRLALVILICLPVAFAPPVEKQKPTKKPTVEDDESFGLAYEHYLKQVVKELEKDEDFVKRLQEGNETAKKSVSHNLDYVAHHIRSKLDELKRQEVDRLNKLQRLLHRKKMMAEGAHPLGGPEHDEDEQEGHRGNNAPPFIPPPPPDGVYRVDMDHIDKRNPYTFEQEDLEKLLKKAAQDIEQNDQMRREEFKRYEMRKEHERRSKLKELDETKRHDEETAFEKAKAEAQKHDKVHYPGRKEQLEDVWEEVDGLPEDQFNPRTFFFLHDTNGDSMLDASEIERLMEMELDKVYNNETNDTLDEIERYEEMNRMREEVFHNVDTNNDELISLDEFLAYSRTKEFSEEDDENWKTIEDEQQFDNEEFQEFEDEYYDFDHQPGEVPPPTMNQQHPNANPNEPAQNQAPPNPNKL